MQADPAGDDDRGEDQFKHAITLVPPPIIVVGEGSSCQVAPGSTRAGRRDDSLAASEEWRRDAATSCARLPKLKLLEFRAAMSFGGTCRRKYRPALYGICTYVPVRTLERSLL